MGAERKLAEMMAEASDDARSGQRQRRSSWVLLLSWLAIFAYLMRWPLRLLRVFRSRRQMATTARSFAP